jgi:hypothetical protein
MLVLMTCSIDCTVSTAPKEFQAINSGQKMSKNKKKKPAELLLEQQLEQSQKAGDDDNDGGLSK